ncbi:hormogonium polysaccharide biosynthesis protein HpsL [Oscillatoria sp. CS-180]|uniref:hormogonium polysaccharide biosynthesis protein HpsL n=1 Tax=Oscillatoria sp. CS-180 TaxID=3021720 RepID=UPI00232BA985|nr:hormogonium polysaccharide biosynthesis protein HpsL [Oscillatoria sp. CS-180]MDB9526579.1 hormogonium polysaccharide biosynthesis protein HpsL [Oscillatoria sp. CS-180]
MRKKRAQKKDGNHSQASHNGTPELSRKEQRKLERKRVRNRQAVIQYATTVAIISAIIALVASFVLEPKLGIGAGLAIACLALSARFPRYAIYGFIFYLPFSGTVTYALGGSAILQLAKDAIFFPALVAVVLFCAKYKQPLIIPAALKIPLIIYGTFLTAVFLFVNGSQQLSNSGGIPLLVGVLGIKALVGYLLLITCIYYLIRTKQDLYFLLRSQVVLIIICCGLALLQYLMLKTGYCQGTIGTGDELFKASLDSRCLVGGALLYAPAQGQIRLPGTFVAPWQWGWFLISSAFFTFGTSFSDRSPLWRILGLVSMAMVFIMAVLSGQRIALALVPFVIILLLFLTGQILNLKRFLPIGIALAVILGIAAIQYSEVVTQSFESFQSRWNAAPPQTFIIEQIEWAINKQRGLLGRGLGRATNAARTFGDTVLVETYHSKVLYEIGPIGLFLMLGVYTVLVITTFKAYRSIKDPNLRGYGASMFTFVLFISYFPYYYPLDVDPVNVYYWLAAGIALKLPDIDRQERLRQSEEEDSARKLTKKELKQLKKSQAAVEFK